MRPQVKYEPQVIECSRRDQTAVAAPQILSTMELFSIEMKNYTRSNYMRIDSHRK